MRANRNRHRYALLLALCLAGASASAIIGSSPAFAVDNMNSKDAPDLTSVRAKIKAADYQGALEYQGELYVKIGEFAKARANLAKLVKLCPQGCEEREDLEKAIETKTVTSH